MMFTAMDRPRIIRVAPFTVILFAVLLSPALAVGTMLLWKGRQIWEGLMLCALFVGLHAYFCLRSVELWPGRLVYRGPLPRREIQLAGIERVTVAAEPPPRLQLWGAGQETPLLAFAIKPFSRGDLASIVRHIQAGQPSVVLDELADRLGQGQVEAVAKATLSSVSLLRVLVMLVGSGVLAGLVRALLRVHGGP
jgi:hypothetical protein